MTPLTFQHAMSVTEILGTIHDGGVQVCANADADFDPAAERVSVALGAYTRRVSTAADDGHLHPAWLPPGESVTEHLPRNEADEFVKDVFHSWVKKVRASMPPNLPLWA